MKWLIAFVAGFISTLVFHQTFAGALYLGGVIGHAPFNMTPTAPFAVPAVISLAFWGGLWGLPLWAGVRKASGARFWILAILIGAIGPTVFSAVVVFPLKGLLFSPATLAIGLLINGVWGLGTAIVIKLAQRACKTFCSKSA